MDEIIFCKHLVLNRVGHVKDSDMNDSKLSQNLSALSHCQCRHRTVGFFLTKYFNILILLMTCSAIQRIAKL